MSRVEKDWQRKAGWLAGWLSPSLSYDPLCLGFFSTFVVRSLPSIYATRLCHAPGFNPSACVSHQSCNRSGRMTPFSDRQRKSSMPIRGPRGVVSRKVDAHRLLIEGWRCLTIHWRKPDSTSIEKRGVCSCGEKEAMVRPCHVTNVTCRSVWGYPIVFSSFFFDIIHLCPNILVGMLLHR
jgi:hypothetical protein